MESLEMYHSTPHSCRLSCVAQNGVTVEEDTPILKAMVREGEEELASSQMRHRGKQQNALFQVGRAVSSRKS